MALGERNTINIISAILARAPDMLREGSIGVLEATWLAFQSFFIGVSVGWLTFGDK